MNRHRLWSLVRLLVAPTFLCLIGAGQLAGQTIAVLTTDNLISTRRTISGASRIVGQEHENASFEEFIVTPDQQKHPELVREIKSAKPDAILTVGSAATEFARKYFEDTPIVFSAVMYPVISGFVQSLNHPGRNVSGASMNIPVDIQFRNFKKVVPDLNNVGVLYTDETAPLIPPSRIVAEEMGLNLIAIKITDQKDLPAALDSLAGVCDGLWSVADPNLYGPQATRFILLHALRHSIPFMGFSRYVVESGALFALDFDYKAIGRQAGQILSRVLDGESPGAIPVTSPDIIWFHYNERTAEHVKVEIPPELSAIAKEVYR